MLQLVEELLNIWSLDDYEQTLEELEEVLIVSPCLISFDLNARVVSYSNQIFVCVWGS